MAYFDTLQATTEMIQVGIERSQAESIAKTIAKVQGDTVTKDHLDLRIEQIRSEIKDVEMRITAKITAIQKEMSDMRQDISFTKWTNKTILVMLGIITSALIKIAFFH